MPQQLHAQEPVLKLFCPPPPIYPHPSPNSFTCSHPYPIHDAQKLAALVPLVPLVALAQVRVKP